MALPTRPANSWMQGLDFPSRVFGDAGSTDYELYEEDATARGKAIPIEG